MKKENDEKLENKKVDVSKEVNEKCKKYFTRMNEYFLKVKTSILQSGLMIEKL